MGKFKRLGSALFCLWQILCILTSELVVCIHEMCEASLLQGCLGSCAKDLGLLGCDTVFWLSGFVTFQRSWCLSLEIKWSSWPAYPCRWKHYDPLKCWNHTPNHTASHPTRPDFSLSCCVMLEQIHYELPSAVTGVYGHSTVYHAPSESFYIYGGYMYGINRTFISNKLYAFHFPTRFWSVLPSFETSNPLRLNLVCIYSYWYKLFCITCKIEVLGNQSPKDTSHPIRYESSCWNSLVIQCSWT